MIRLMLFFVVMWAAQYDAAYGQQSQSDSIYMQVDVIPRFPGGITAWNKFLQSNLELKDAVNALDSTALVKYGNKQTAVLQFTVCEDGEVCDIIVANESRVLPQFTDEVLRVMKMSPKWKPGTQRGQAVRSRFRQPVTVYLDQY